MLEVISAVFALIFFTYTGSEINGRQDAFCVYFSDFASKKYAVEAKYCVYVFLSRFNEADRCRIGKKYVLFHSNEAETSSIDKKTCSLFIYLLANDTDTVSQS